MEFKQDVQVLEHMQSHGDISNHKMCADCRIQYRDVHCPFCNEIIHKEQFVSFINDLIASWSSSVQHNSNPDVLAAVFENWQMIEMEFDHDHKSLLRLAKLIIEDKSFYVNLSEGVRVKAPWMRDMSGCIFRFWSFINDSHLQVSSLHATMLQGAVDAILEPFERATPVRLYGHFYGGLYMQVLTPWLCAKNSALHVPHLTLIVQRVAAAIVHCYQTYRSENMRREITERMHREYLLAAQQALWGSEAADVVWKIFYT
jgi:hypothetical protein